MKRRVSHLWMYGLIVLLIINSIVVLRDILPRISLKLARSNMAAELSNDNYLLALHKKALDLLVSPQAVPLSDNRRLLVLDDLRIIIKGDALSFSWPAAILTKAIAGIDFTVPVPRNFHVLQAYYDQFLTIEGSLKMPPQNLDVALQGEALVHLAQRTGDSRYHRAADEVVQYLLDRSKSEGLSLAYRPYYLGNVRLTDSLGMTAPFLAQYGTFYNNSDVVQLAVSQIKEFIRYGIDPNSGLPFYGYNPEKNYSPVGILGEGRLSGWYALGPIDTLRQLPRESVERKELEPSASLLAQSISFYQNKDGGWSAIVNAPSLFDFSITAMFIYFLCSSTNEGIIDVSYKDTIKKSVAALKWQSRIDGTVDFAQGYQVDINQASSYNAPTPYAQGMALLAVSLAVRIYPD